MADAEDSDNQNVVPNELMNALLHAQYICATVWAAHVTPRQALLLIDAGARPIHAEDAERLKVAGSIRRMFYFEPAPGLRDRIKKYRMRHSEFWQHHLMRILG